MTTGTQSGTVGVPWSPKEYQVEGIKMLLQQGAVALFLDPGLGKTSLVLAALKILKARTLINKVLIVAPLRPMYKVWPDEVAKWSDFNHMVVSVLHGPNKQWNLEAEADLYIINPEGLQWLLNNPKRPEFDVLVIDESTKFKNHASKRFKLLKSSLPLFKRRWILTGTPSPNGLEGLFSQIYILDLGRALGRFITHFRKNYFQQDGWNQYDISPKPGSFEQIVERISPLVYQLSAEDHLKMPKLVFKNLEVTPPPATLKMYNSFANSNVLLTPKGAEVIAGTEAVLSGRLHQVANGAIYTDAGSQGNKEYEVLHDEKLDALESYIEELSGKPTLVIYEYNHDLERIRARLGAVPNLGAGISIKAMESLVDQFNAGTIPVMLGHPGSMGHGLNLQGSCHHIIWFSVPWDLDFYDQTIARVYRQGQQADTVYVYHIVSKGTKDEDILTALDEKDKAQQKLLRALK
jgi:SNF2 family DNA or RNA helicase